MIGAEASLSWFGNGSDAHPSAVNNRLYEWSTYSSGVGGRVVGLAGYGWGDFLPYVKGGGWA